MENSNNNESTGPNSEVSWDEVVQAKFSRMIAKIPIFLREIAKAKVSKKAESLARENNRTVVCEKDLVDAFFSETPFGFHGPMKTDMEDIELDYVKYGHPQ